MNRALFGKVKEIKKLKKPRKIRKVMWLPLIVLLIVFNSPLYAKNLGKVGQVYPIKEVDMLDFIQTRLKQMKKDGRLEKINKKMIETAKTRADRPIPVKNISPTKTYRKWFIDPSITFKQEITDANGTVVVKAGTVVNPLKRRSLKTPLIFFDGNNKHQVDWVRKKDKLLHGNNKLILVSGSVAEQTKRFKKAIYFDQHGRMVDKFKIKHTPAIVTQEGVQFKVEELVS